MNNRKDANIDPIILGGLLRHHRQLLGLSQLQLAVRADINSSYLSAVENGHNIISFMKLLKICTALEVKPNDLIKQFLYLREQFYALLRTNEESNSFAELETIRNRITVNLPNLLKKDKLLVAESEDEYNDSDDNVSDTLTLE